MMPKLLNMQAVSKQRVTVFVERYDHKDVPEFLVEGVQFLIIYAINQLVNAQTGNMNLECGANSFLVLWIVNLRTDSGQRRKRSLI